MGINIALMKFALKSMSGAGEGPDGQVWAIYGPHVVRDGPDWTQNIRFLLGINIALLKIALKLMSGAGDGPYGQV